MLGLGRGVEVEGKVTHGVDEEGRGESRLRVTGACKLGGEGLQRCRTAPLYTQSSHGQEQCESTTSWDVIMLIAAEQGWEGEADLGRTHFWTDDG